MIELPGLQHADIRLEPLGAGHLEDLREACAADPAIWDIYSYSMLGDAFDRWWEGLGASGWQMWAVLEAGRLVGTTGLYADPRLKGVIEIGGTYLAPAARGGGVNRTMKWLALCHLFQTGTRRVEFRVDARNLRSQAAVLKLGAVREGILRRHKITHTGFVRDTHVFAITDIDWPRLEPELRPFSPAR